MWKYWILETLHKILVGFQGAKEKGPGKVNPKKSVDQKWHKFCNYIWRFILFLSSNLNDILSIYFYDFTHLIIHSIFFFGLHRAVSSNQSKHTSKPIYGRAGFLEKIIVDSPNLYLILGSPIWESNEGTTSPSPSLYHTLNIHFNLLMCNLEELALDRSAIAHEKSQLISPFSYNGALHVLLYLNLSKMARSKYGKKKTVLEPRFSGYHRISGRANTIQK